MVLFKRGNTADNDAYVGMPGEISIDTEAHNIRIHDGVTPGGYTTNNSSQTYQYVIETLLTSTFNSDVYVNSTGVTGQLAVAIPGAATDAEALALTLNDKLITPHSLGVVLDDFSTNGIDLSGYATTSALSSGLALKADASSLSDYSTTTEMNSALALKADASSLDNYATTSALALKADTTSLGNYLALTGGTLTGGVSESIATANDSASGTIALNASTKCIYPITAIGDITFTLTGTAGSSIVVVGTNLGNYTITYPSTVAFTDGVIPTLTEDGKDVLMFFTNDGTNWNCAVLNNLAIPE